MSLQKVEQVLKYVIYFVLASSFSIISYQVPNANKSFAVKDHLHT